MPDPWQRRQRRLAMRIDRRVADGIQFAFSRRLNGVGFFLALVERRAFRSFFVWLTGDERVGARHIERESLVICRRCVLVQKRETGSITDERHGVSREFLARRARRRSGWLRRRRDCLWSGRWRRSDRR